MSILTEQASPPEYDVTSVDFSGRDHFRYVGPPLIAVHDACLGDARGARCWASLGRTIPRGRPRLRVSMSTELPGFLDARSRSTVGACRLFSHGSLMNLFVIPPQSDGQEPGSLLFAEGLLEHALKKFMHSTPCRATLGPGVWPDFAGLAASECGRGETGAVSRFREEIEPILIDHCYRCHANGTKKGGVCIRRVRFR